VGEQKADILGYSLGGGVALQTAIRHPELVRKLVLISTPFKRSGWYPEVLEEMAQMITGREKCKNYTALLELDTSVLIGLKIQLLSLKIKRCITFY
jgi:pimeloyl-ACP methyl ester carboxylesterase